MSIIDNFILYCIESVCVIQSILKSPSYREILYSLPFIFLFLWSHLFLIFFGLSYFWISKHNFVPFKTLSSLLLFSLIQFVLISRVLLLEFYYERLIEPISTTSLLQTASLNPLSHFLLHTLSKPLSSPAIPNPSYIFFQGCFASFFTSNPNSSPLRTWVFFYLSFAPILRFLFRFR